MTLFEITILCSFALLWIVSGVLNLYFLSREEPRILDTVLILGVLTAGPFYLKKSIEIYRLYLQSKKEAKKEDS